MTRLDPLDLMVRCVVGFLSGFIVAFFVLVFIGVLPPHHDLSQSEFEQQRWSLWLAFYIACGVAVCTMFIGRISVSKFWLRFMIAFGITCIIPFWPHKSGLLLPFATPYMNFGFQLFHLLMLGVQVVVAFAVAVLFHFGLPWKSKRQATAQSRAVIEQ